MGCCKPPGQPRHSVPPYSVLRCLAKPGYGLFHDVGRRRKLKGWARTWMSHHQIPRQDGNQAERCDGNLPFASRLMALLSTTVIGRDRLLSKAKSHFSAVTQTAGFGL